MKAVLISIQPKWCELIANGKKTVEVRKTKPKIDAPFKVYIYCTADRRKHIADTYVPQTPLFVKNGNAKSSIGREDGLLWKLGNDKVIGEFVCKNITYIDARIDSDGYRHLGNTLFLQNRMCLSDNELFDYLYKGENENNGGWAWHISDLVIYDKPKELSEFTRFCEGVDGTIGCRGCKYYYIENNESSGKYEECLVGNSVPLKRPPQSWCYVEEGATDERN